MATFKHRLTWDGKWHDVWFRRLSPSAKLAFFWVIENCDCAGFVEADARTLRRADKSRLAENRYALY